jgi:hypothetical protein
LPFPFPFDEPPFPLMDLGTFFVVFTFGVRVGSLGT